MMYKLIDVKKDSVFDYVQTIHANNGKVLGYKVLKSIAYFSARYGKLITIDCGDLSDGATYAPDLDSWGWLIHDELKNTEKFADGTSCTNIQASTVLSDIMAEEGMYFRRITWFIGTWLFGMF